jgi:hypothetical protein
MCSTGLGVIKIKYKKRVDLATWLAPCVPTLSYGDEKEKIATKFWPAGNCYDDTSV